MSALSVAVVAVRRESAAHPAFFLVPKRKTWERKFPAKLCFATVSPLHPVTEVRFR